jgi:type VI secretion system secreted protein Hcp
MWLTGQKQGNIKGGVSLAGRKDSILVLGCNHEIISPRDIASGLPTGQRQHKPLTITKALDCSSPLLMNVLATNENIKTLLLQFWQTDRVGKEVPLYSIRLDNASISAVRFEMPFDSTPESKQYPEHEVISFCYGKISWTWEQGGISAQDDWQMRI